MDLNTVDKNSSQIDISESPNKFSNINNNNQPVNYILYRRRWFGLLTIVILNLLGTGTNRLTFTVVSEVSEEWFHTGKTLVNLTVILQYVIYIFATPISGFVFEKWGLKTGLVVGAILNLVGCWIRYLGAFIDSTDDSYLFRYVIVMIGHVASGAGQTFFNNATPQYAAMWFDDKGRGTATTIGSLGNPLSSAIASVVLPALIDEESDMKGTLLYLAITATLISIPAFVMSPKPPTPPSASAQTFSESSGSLKTFWTSVKSALKNFQYLIILGCFSIFVAFFNTFTSYVSQFVKPYGYTEDDGGIFASILIGTGILGAAVAGPFLDKTKMHKTLIKVCTPLIAASYVALIFVIREDSYVLICIVCALLGLFSFALLPTSFELSIECTYPNPPSTSSSLNWIGAEFLSVVVLAIVNSLTASEDADPPENMKKGLIFMGIVSCITALSIYFYNSPNHRMEAEEKAKKINTSDEMQISTQVSN